jgi:hypothetical protein
MSLSSKTFNVNDTVAKFTNRFCVSTSGKLSKNTESNLINHDHLLKESHNKYQI